MVDAAIIAINGGVVQRFLRDIVDFTHKIEGAAKEDAKQTVRYLLAHAKPTEGKMVISGEFIDKEFHQESEWRYVPKNVEIKDYLKRPEFENEEVIEINNNLTKQYCSIKFTPKDIKYIFVKSDSDIPDIINFIQTELDYFPSSDLKVLMSRVTSLESIRRDI